MDDGSIADLVVWRAVAANDVISVPAGTIHAIGAGLVIAEVQQRSDATFRLFDYGRQRELHVERAIAVANTGRADVQMRPSRLTDERTLLVSNPHFVFERIDLAPASTCSLEAERETWLLVLSGDAVVGTFNVGKGDAIFAHSERVDIRTGKIGLTGLVAYAAHSPHPDLLQRLKQPDSTDARRPKDGHGTALAHAGNGWTWRTAAWKQLNETTPVVLRSSAIIFRGAAASPPSPMICIGLLRWRVQGWRPASLP